MVSQAVGVGGRPRFGSIAPMTASERPSVDPADRAPDPRVEAWRTLAGPEAAALVAAADEIAHAGATPAAIMRMRGRFPGAPVSEAIELAAARRRGMVKFPNASSLLLDRHGVEQATSAVVAAWKAGRFGDRAVLDLCCGIGGDAMALAARGPCIGVDRDPVRALMTACNAGIETRVAAVESTSLDAPLVHLDPARRDERSGRRSWRLDDLVPGLDEIARIVGAVDGAAVKLGPGLPLPPPRWHDRQSLSVIAEGRRLVQAVLWTGDLARVAPCEAVDLPSGDTIEGAPTAWPMSGLVDGEAFGEVLLELHPAVERLGVGPAALREAFGDAAADYREPAVGLGLVTGPRSPVESAIDRGVDRWFRAVAIEATVPARLERVADVVTSVAARFGAGRVIVRTRAGAVDADAWTRRLDAITRDRDADGPAIEVGGWRLGRRTVVTVGVAMSASDQSAP